MINWLKGSLLYRFFLKLLSIFYMGSIYKCYLSFRNSYKYSRFKIFYDKFISESITPQGTAFAKFTATVTRFIHKWGDYLIHSVIYKLIFAICSKISAFFSGSIIGKFCSFMGFRGFLLMAFSLYLPLDYFIRNVIGISFLSSLWDEGLMALVLCYILFRKSTLKRELPIKTTSLDAYIFAFIGVLFFLMCVVAPYPSIAVDGMRATMQYILWFFLILRLIEDDRDFKIFYITLCTAALVIGFHGIYQFIVAVPIPAGWVSQTEDDVRTRVFSIMGSPNIMGSFLVLFAPMVAAVAYYHKKFWVKFTAICLTGVMCLSILFTYSKGAWFGIAVAVIVFAIFLDRRLIALMATAASLILIFVPSITGRITYLFTDDYRAASLRDGRMIRWEKGLELLHDSNPFLGFGLGRFGGAVAMQNQVIEETETFSYFYLDNYYLKTLVETGYLGLTFFIIMLIGLVIWSLKAIGKTKTSPINPLIVGMFSGLCGVMVHCYFENIFEVPYMMAYFWGVAAGIVYLGYFRRNRIVSIKK